MAWCLVPDKADLFKKMLLDGSISPDKLNDMTSKERSEFFGKNFGVENGKEINALFESKLLLKNAKEGMISWAEKVLAGNPTAKRDIVSRIERMDKRILDPQSQDEFLEELASKKLGISISFDQAKEITNKAAEIEKRKSLDMTNEENRISYGESIIELEDYLNQIAGRRMSGIDQVANLLNAPRTAMSTIDLSAPLRQGWGMLSRKEFYKAFGEMFQYAASEKAFNRLRADIITRETYPLMKKAKLRITKISDKLTEREEAFMSNLLDRFPGVKASERAYVGFLNKLRADVFDSIYRDAQAAGEITGDSKADEKILLDIGSVVNDFTGAGNLGRNDEFAGAAPLASAFFFSPRKTMATVNKFNPVNYVRLSHTARKAALRQLLGSLGITATVIALAVMAGADFEDDPRSADFGKIILGDTRLDVSGGEANYLVLLARLITGKSKSTNTDLVRGLDGGFGGQTRLDVAGKWLRNKLSPVASFVADALAGENAIGEKFEIKKALIQRMIPLSIQSIIDLVMNDRDVALLGGILNIFGVGTQTYSKGENWENSTSKELAEFKETVGEERFKAANDRFNKEFERRLDNLSESNVFQNLDDENQAKAVKSLKDEIKDEIFKVNRFKYKKEKQDARTKSKIKSAVKNSRLE